MHKNQRIIIIYKQQKEKAVTINDLDAEETSKFNNNKSTRQIHIDTGVDSWRYTNR